MNIFQFISEGFKIAVGAIRANRLRSFLTMLGVAIGIFVLTGILSMVDSMKHSVTDNLSALGNTTMFVHNWPWKDNSEDWFKYWGRPKVSYRDYQKVRNNIKNVVGVSYEVSFSGQSVKFEGRSLSGIKVAGVTEDYEAVGGADLYAGRFFSGIEFARGTNVCVIGYDIASQLFPKQNPLGKKIRVAGKRLTVIGILAKVGISIGPSVDETIYAPYLASARMYNTKKRWVDKVMVVKAVNYDKVEYVESELVGLMRASRGLKPDMEDNFSINKQEMLMEQMNSFFKFLEGGGTVISIFSVLIGVFSIGLIMYISVRERTKEIGIQKSLGATRGFVLYQFLTEAVLICLIGGLIGLLLVYLMTSGIQSLVDKEGIPLDLVVSGYGIQLSLLISFATGILAGIIPASMAASVDPVIAIRFK